VQNDDFDAVVIGAGAGGGFAAMALAEGGMRVLLLDRGKRFDPARDFPMIHDDWELRGSAFAEGDGGHEPSLLIEIGPRIAPTDQDLCSRWLGYDKPTGCGRRSPVRYLRVFGLGGSTLHYAGEAHRFADYAFRPQTLYGHGDADWPIGYTDLEPYYQRAEAILGVAGESGNPFKSPRGAFPTPAHPLSSASQYVAQGAAKLGWTVRPNSLAIPSRPHEGRPACQGSGGCTLGCPIGAKSSTDLTAIARGERAGRLTVLPDSRVVQLETASDGKIVGAVYAKNGVRQVARGRVYVLAGGAIETPRLLLASAGGKHQYGIGNASGQVGCYLMETLSAGLTVRFDADLRSYRGQVMNSRVWDLAPPPGDGSRAGFVLGVSITDAWHGPSSYARSLPGMGLAHKNRMRERFGRVATLLGIGDHEPRAENRLVLDNRTDPDGVPLASLRLDYSKQDRETLRTILRKLEAWADACGAVERLGSYSSYSHPVITHSGGTCRMGDDPATSVVDKNGRCHEAENLYITDASVLVSQGAGDSPSLTIQALALRTADNILAAARGSG
jgi:choline dehydrogenase-like flavoprotein